MGFSRQEYWSGLPFSTPGDLPNPWIEPMSPALAGRFLPLRHQGSSWLKNRTILFFFFQFGFSWKKQTNKKKLHKLKWANELKEIYRYGESIISRPPWGPQRSHRSMTPSHGIIWECPSRDWIKWCRLIFHLQGCEDGSHWPLTHLRPVTMWLLSFHMEKLPLMGEIMIMEPFASHDGQSIS